MSKKLLMVVHQETSNTGRIGAKLRDRGYELDTRCPMLGDSLPEHMDDHAGAVIFGGPMSANDGDTMPGIRAELDWIPVVLDSGRPFLGVCLGAQMLSRVLGGRVDFHPDGMAEIGYFEIRPTNHGNGLFGDQPLTVYHWHREGFEVVPDSVLLAEGDMFPNQAFRHGERAYGIQFHPEVTKEIMMRWLVKAAHRLVMPGAQSREKQLAGHPRHDPKIADWLDNFLDHWLVPAPGVSQDRNKVAQTA